MPNDYVPRARENIFFKTGLNSQKDEQEDQQCQCAPLKIIHLDIEMSLVAT